MGLLAGRKANSRVRERHAFKPLLKCCDYHPRDALAIPPKEHSIWHVERCFRDLTHECSYQTECANMHGLRHLMAKYVDKFNFGKLHSSLGCLSPAEWCFSGINAPTVPT